MKRIVIGCAVLAMMTGTVLYAAFPVSTSSATIRTDKITGNWDSFAFKWIDENDQQCNFTLTNASGFVNLTGYYPRARISRDNVCYVDVASAAITISTTGISFAVAYTNIPPPNSYDFELWVWSTATSNQRVTLGQGKVNVAKSLYTDTNQFPFPASGDLTLYATWTALEATSNAFRSADSALSNSLVGVINAGDASVSNAFRSADGDLSNSLAAAQVSLSNAIAATYATLTGVSAVSNAFRSADGDLSNSLISAQVALSNAVDTTYATKTMVQVCSNAFRTADEALSNSLVGVIGTVVGTASNAAVADNTALSNALMGVIQTTSNAIPSAIGAVSNSLVGLIDGGDSTVSNAFRSADGAMSNSLATIIQTTSNSIPSAIGAVSNSLMGVVQGASNRADAAWTFAQAASNRAETAIGDAAAALTFAQAASNRAEVAVGLAQGASNRADAAWTFAQAASNRAETAYGIGQTASNLAQRAYDTSTAARAVADLWPAASNNVAHKSAQNLWTMDQYIDPAKKISAQTIDNAQWDGGAGYVAPTITINLTDGSGGVWSDDGGNQITLRSGTLTGTGQEWSAPQNISLSGTYIITFLGLTNWWCNYGPRDYGNMTNTASVMTTGTAYSTFAPTGHLFAAVQGRDATLLTNRVEYWTYAGIATTATYRATFGPFGESCYPMEWRTSCDAGTGQVSVLQKAAADAWFSGGSTMAVIPMATSEDTNAVWSQTVLSNGCRFQFRFDGGTCTNYVITGKYWR